ncbi:uncharacterized protein BO66DRAFT_238440 [Aspergillus aculeatinus CBS 121060]|uniref:Uncharacterized protein n=1 Tax=Aspergillus aculeatinus CBS 121060 TaxID=1448322 RepID=A0ACD1HIC9_9EURO|nr:hypothetical protein BO66DRAFT_238440 [Aspergillus aculeatinus CBS 121060]RAH73266.1 hypothetical protein BO66DRAFT_238440 [Aspergillus aculeatinus CBS 121060]
MRSPGCGCCAAYSGLRTNCGVRSPYQWQRGRTRAGGGLTVVYPWPLCINWGNSSPRFVAGAAVFQDQRSTQSSRDPRPHGVNASRCQPGLSSRHRISLPLLRSSTNESPSLAVEAGESLYRRLRGEHLQPYLCNMPGFSESITCYSVDNGTLIDVPAIPAISCRLRWRCG